MHFRDAMYPIKIRRYLAEGSMVTDSQRIGVLTGQFIRAQRLCSVMPMFKDAIKNVVLAAMRRGYKKGELDRVWGRFLKDWWMAQEIRRGELRAWFRRLMRVVSRDVEIELRGGKLQTTGKRHCWFGANCRYKTLAFHSNILQRKPRGVEAICKQGKPR